MLPRSNRLPSSMIKTVMRRGKHVNVAGTQLVIAHNGLSLSRFAVIVPGGVDKRATTRNRIRRVAREALRGALLQISPGWDCVVFARKDPPNIQDALRAAGLL